MKSLVFSYILRFVLNVDVLCQGAKSDTVVMECPVFEDVLRLSEYLN